MKHSRSTSRRHAFTLPEIIAVLCIMGLLASISVPLLRSPSPSSVLEQSALEFEAFCARVRYQAIENGRDRVIAFDSFTNMFFMRVPDSAGGEEEENTPEAASLRWKLPKDFEFIRSDAEDSGKYLDLFRFFPDGGASGMRILRFRFGKFQRIFEVSALTGFLESREPGENEQ